MEKFSFDIDVRKKVKVEANSLEEAIELAKKEFLKTIKDYNFNIISYKNESEWEKDVINNCREEVVECIDDNIYDLAEAHLECWKDRYFGKTESQILYDLDRNHDFDIEADSIENKIGFKLDYPEYKYLKESLKKALLKVIFYY